MLLIICLKPLCKSEEKRDFGDDSVFVDIYRSEVLDEVFEEAVVTPQLEVQNYLLEQRIVHSPLFFVLQILALFFATHFFPFNYSKPTFLPGF